MENRVGKIKYIWLRFFYKQLINFLPYNLFCIPCNLRFTHSEDCYLEHANNQYMRVKTQRLPEFLLADA